MNKIALLFMIISFSCTTKGNKVSQKLESEYKQEIMKKTYFADFNFKGDFEIIFNGISLKRNKSTGVSHGLEYLNPFIEKSGKQSITLIIKPLSGKIPPSEVKDYYIDIVYTNNGEASPINNVMRCSFPSVKEPVDSLVYTWIFDAEVPYEITTLNDAKNLSDEDPKKLLEEIVSEYSKVHNLINTGNILDIMKLYKNSREREMISMYYDEDMQKEYLDGIKRRTLSSKGLMQPLEDYKILLHPNNKIVSMTNSKGKSPLFSKDSEGNIKSYGLQLYRSIKTGKLEIY